MKIKGCLSHKSDDWATPKYIYDQIIAKNIFDPCPLYSLEDGLKIEWKKSNFVNPPYSKLKKWIEKSIEQNSKGKQVILLIPARTDTQTFKQLFDYGSEISFITGRLRFNESNNAPFPSMLIKLIGGGQKNTKCLLINREDIKI